MLSKNKNAKPRHPIGPSDFTYLKLLGKGSFGEVYLVTF
jgi:hypothetical protein